MNSQKYSVSVIPFITREGGRISGHVKSVCVFPSACNGFVFLLVWKVLSVLHMGKKGDCPWRTNSASLSNTLQESLVTLGWQLQIGGQCLLHLFCRVIQWAWGGGCRAVGRVHGVKDTVGHGHLRNTQGYLQNRKKKIIRSCLLIKLEASPVLPKEQSSAIHHRFLQVWMQKLLQSSESPSHSKSLPVVSNSDNSSS